MKTPSAEAIEAAAHWLITFIEEGGEVMPGCLFFTCEPPMPSRVWLNEALTGEVKDVVFSLTKKNPDCAVQAAVRDAVRGIIAAGGGVASLH